MKPTEASFAGINGFVWWMGIVESRKDPMNLGRCQVRIFGWHTENLTDIPTDDLPWAHPVYPLNNNNFGTPKESEMVFGFFADGMSAQVPIMMGVVPTIPNEGSTSGVGFNDIRNDSELSISPKRIQSISYGGSGSGATVVEGSPKRYPVAGKPTISGLSRNDPDEGNPTTSRKKRGSVKIPTIKNGNVRTPNPSYNPVYPYNQVVESESGHSLEFDDSPGSERVELNHRSGTYFEIQPDGSKVEEIVKKNYTVVMSDDHVYIMGNAIVTVDSSTRIRAKGDLTIEAGNNLNLKVAGNMNMTISGDLAIKARNIKMESDISTSVKSTISTSIESSVGSTNIRGLTGINATSSSGGINLRAPIINSLGALSLGTFSAEIADFAPPSGLTELLPTALSADGFISQIPSLSSSELQSTLMDMDSSTLDSVLESASSSDISKLVSSLGDTFSSTDFVDKMSTAGMAGFLNNSGTSEVSTMIEKLRSGEFDSQNGLNSFMNKINSQDIENLTSKINFDQITSIVKETDVYNVDKLVSGLTVLQIKDVANLMDQSGLQKLVGDCTGDSLIKIKQSLNPEELSKISNKLSLELKDKFNTSISELSGKFNLPTRFEDLPGVSSLGSFGENISSTTKNIATKFNIASNEIGSALAAIEGLPDQLNFNLSDLAGKLNVSPQDLASKLQMPVGDLSSAISLPKVDLFSILEALDIESNFSIADLSGSLLTIKLPS